MKPAIILACSMRKRETDEPLPAYQLYAGPLWLTLRSWDNPSARVTRCDAFALSAKHGLIPATQEIAPYDLALGKRPTWPDATDARSAVLARELARNRPAVFFAGGEKYRNVMLCWLGLTLAGRKVTCASGGIGKQRQQLQSFILNQAYERPS